MERRKPGPVPKGPRETQSVRFPPEQKAVYKAAAKAAGLSLCDYVALVMAERHKLQVPEYVVRAQRAHALKSAQEDALPISA